MHSITNFWVPAHQLRTTGIEALQASKAYPSASPGGLHASYRGNLFRSSLPRELDLGFDCCDVEYKCMVDLILTLLSTCLRIKKKRLVQNKTDVLDVVNITHLVTMSIFEGTTFVFIGHYTHAVHFTAGFLNSSCSSCSSADQNSSPFPPWLHQSTRYKSVTHRLPSVTRSGLHSYFPGSET